MVFWMVMAMVGITGVAINAAQIGGNMAGSHPSPKMQIVNAIGVLGGAVALVISLKNILELVIS